MHETFLERCFALDRWTLLRRVAVRVAILGAAAAIAIAFAHWSAWALLALLGAGALLSLAMDGWWWSLRRSARATLTADPSALVAVFFDAKTAQLELWLRDASFTSGFVPRGAEAALLDAAERQPSVFVARASEDREAITRWSTCAQRVTDIEAELARSALGAIATDHFAAFAQRWRATTPATVRNVSERLARLLDTAWIHARAARDYERTVGPARAYAGAPEDMPFVRELAADIVLLQAALDTANA